MTNTNDISKQKRILIFKVLVSLLILLGILLGTAGTWAFWQAWMLVAALSVIMTYLVLYFLKTDPTFLNSRMKYWEKDKSQTKLIPLTQIFLLILFLLPGFDFRWSWSQIPSSVCFFAFIIFLLAYGFIIWVFKTNRFASRIVEIQPEQKVITNGPYTKIRHPMYLGMIILLPALMLSLGSLTAAVIGTGIVIPLVIRIRGEEALLLKELPDYAEYCQKTPYRLIPFVW